MDEDGAVVKSGDLLRGVPVIAAAGSPWTSPNVALPCPPSEAIIYSSPCELTLPSGYSILNMQVCTLWRMCVSEALSQMVSHARAQYGA